MAEEKSCCVNRSRNCCVRQTGRVTRRGRGDQKKNVLVLGVRCTCFLTPIGTGEAEARNAAQEVIAGVLFL